MRILTTIAGVIICGAGAFCFAVNMNTFADVAFLVGLTMMVAGILHTIAYLISGRGENRLTDTALVEGAVTFFYGFAVINDQVTDGTLAMFFGTWLTLCGISRVSQSLYVSRFNRRDWAKIMPLGILAAIFGIVMMMPSLVKNVLPLMLVGGAMILDGLSGLVFAMFMRRSDADPGKSEQAAKERAAAKKALMKVKREQRDKLRNLSKEEREAVQTRIRTERKAMEDAKKRERDQRKQARREASELSSRATIPITKEDVSRILSAAPLEQLAEDIKILEEHADEALSDASDISGIYDDYDAQASDLQEDLNITLDAEGSAPQAVRSEEELRNASKASFRIPSIIPHIHFSHPKREENNSKPNDGLVLSAINVRELEENPELNFEPVELKEPELESAKSRPVDRSEVLQSIEATELPKLDNVDYVPINFDDLSSSSEVPAKDNSDSSDDRWTQVLNFNWKEVEITEE